MPTSFWSRIKSMVGGSASLIDKGATSTFLLEFESCPDFTVVMDPKHEKERKSCSAKEEYRSPCWRKERKLTGKLYKKDHETETKSEHSGQGLNYWQGEDSESDAEVEAEFTAALKKANVGNMGISRDPAARSIVEGFRINWMDMRDADTRQLLWESGEWSDEMFHTELKATVPRTILDCAAVSREINFTSKREIRQFRLEQRVFLDGSCIEEWFFDFGFVIPGSTNSWQQTIESAGRDRMLSADQISGKMTIETTFLDGAKMLCKTLVRIFYD